MTTIGPQTATPIALRWNEPVVRFLDVIESAVSFDFVNAAIGKRNRGFGQARGQGHELWDIQFAVEEHPGTVKASES